MEPTGSSHTNRTERSVFFSLLLVFLAAMPRIATGQDVDRTLVVEITHTNENVILGWFASNAVPYQVESSTTLTNWGDASLVITGAGTWLSTTNPMGRINHNFYRVKRLPPPQVISASFSPFTGVLTVIGDDQPNTITVSRNAAGALFVNGGTVAILGGTPTVANTTLIRIFGREGNDVLALDEANGALPMSEMSGEAGNDTLTGGSGGDTLDGGPGDDTLLGRGGFDVLFGRTGNDTLTGGDADDQVFGDEDNDRMIWNPGDDTDLNEGGAGTDTVEVNGGGGAEVFTTTANGTRVRFDRLDPAPFSIDIGTGEQLVLNCNGGNDSSSATGNLAALIQITVNGGAGDDTILGSNGNDLLQGGDGNDFIDGQQGNDTVNLGAGDDVFQWDPGDGSDTVEGQAGTDTLLFNGSAGNEIFTATPNGGRVLFTRNLGSIIMDLDDIETLDLNLLGGTDSVTVNHLAGTDLTSVNVDLAGTIGGAAGDAAADVVIVNGSNGADIIDVAGAGTSFSVVGLSASVNITNTEGANDSLVVNSLGGDDGVTATTLPAGVVSLTIDGGAGDDTLLGSQGADVFLGGSENDFIFGDNGNDVAFMGAGNDVFQWDPGDGNDTLEGQDGADRMLFFGSNASETINVSANGGRVLFFRDVAAVTMDLDDVESIDYRALGGADNIVVGDLAGTDMTGIGLDLRGPNGGGDGAADTVTVNGTNGNDTFGAAGDSAGVNVFGLPAAVNIFFQESASDRLTLNALGGNDVVDASSLEAGGIQLTMNGGLGADVFIGSAGDDLINGGDGNDTALMGAGNDTFVWNPGDDNDTLEGQAGTDTLLFNGANVAENIGISANGGRVIFFRDVASVTMDLNDVEGIDFNALGGADTIVVNSLSGTDVTGIDLDLAEAVNVAGPDTIIVNGSNGADIVDVTGAGTSASVLGLSASVNITNTEGAIDSLVVNSLGGDDVVTATTLPAGVIKLTIDGGAGDDTLLGSQGADVFLGGSENDFIFGDNGNDTAFMGAGNDVFQWDPGDGNDLIEGQDGADRMLFFGSNASETINVSANGGRVLFFRDVAAVTMDLDDVESIDYRALGGADNVVVGDLSGTDLTAVGLDLRGPNGGGDGAADTVTVNGTNGNDTFGAAGDSASVGVFGLPAAVNIFFQEPASDRLTLNALGGDDVVDGSSLEADGIQLTINGGLGADVLIGSEGDDLINGGDGNDTALMGAGNDTFVWNPGDDNDTLEGQAGTDTLLFNGSNVAETIDISANGGRVIFFRNVASVTMDLNDVEGIDFNALGGADIITLNNLAGTDVTAVNLDLASTIGGTAGDAAIDTITVNGSAAADVFNLTANAGIVSVARVGMVVSIEHPEVANDDLIVNGLGGVDVFNLGAGVTTLIGVTTNQ